MNNFEFYTPTRMIFGRGTHLQVGKIVKEYGFKKVLVHFGGASAKKTGLLDAVCSALEAEGIGYVQLGGVQANPTLSMAKKGIELCLAEKVDFVLAVGGGVIDSAKCIADGAGSPGADVWKFFTKEAAPSGALPVGTILTLSASGSEMSASCVITNEENGLKRGFNSTTHRPLFSICNPELTYTVNRFQTGCGTVDIMMHTLERYMGGTTKETPLTDRIAEGLLKSVAEAGAIADQDPENYEARATLMWAGSLSHNDLTSAGRAFMMQVHQMEHELSGMYPQIAHGAGLSALWPSWARYVCAAWPERFAQYAVRVWNLEMNFENPMETALAGIKVTEDYFKSLDMPTNIRDLGVEPEKIDVMAEKCTNFGTRTLPGIKELGKTEMMEIYRMAMEA